MLTTDRECDAGEVVGASMSDGMSPEHVACIARIEDLERERVSITNAVQLVPGASADAIVSSIRRLRSEISNAKETLAPYCPEADPSRCSLGGVVDLLVGDVLAGLGDEPWTASRRIKDLTVDVQRLTRLLSDSRSEAATQRAILASVPQPDEDEP